MHWRSRWWFLIFHILFHPYCGKWSNLTNIFFQMAWNHQLACICWYMITIWSLVWPNLYMLFVLVNHFFEWERWGGKVGQHERFTKSGRGRCLTPTSTVRITVLLHFQDKENCKLQLDGLALSLYFQTLRLQYKWFDVGTGSKNDMIIISKVRIAVCLFF